VNTFASPLFGWADAYQPGIPATVRFAMGGTNTTLDKTMKYDAGLRTLVNELEGIAMMRRPNGSLAENVAFAIEGGTVGQKISLNRYQNVRLDDGTNVTNYITWSYVDENNHIWEWRNKGWHQLILI
jgi:hypothetical protein